MSVLPLAPVLRGRERATHDDDTADPAAGDPAPPDRLGSRGALRGQPPRAPMAKLREQYRLEVVDPNRRGAPPVLAEVT